MISPMIPPTGGRRLRRRIPFRRWVTLLPGVLLLAALAAPAAAADDPTPEEVFGTFLDILGQAAQQGNQPPAAPAAVPAGFNLSTDVYLKNNAGQYVRITNPVRGRMVEGDHSFSDGCVGDYFYYDGAVNERVIITLTSANLDTLLYLLDLDGNTLGMDDDAGGDYNSRLSYTLPREGFYQILVTTTDPNMERRPNRDVYGEYENDGWPARRSAWVSEVKATTEVTRMNGLINEFDSAVSNSSRVDNDDWY